MVETMAKLELVLSERFGEVDAETLRATLSNHLTVGKANRLLRRGTDPNLASVIQLIGDVANCLLLKALGHWGNIGEIQEPGARLGAGRAFTSLHN